MDAPNPYAVGAPIEVFKAGELGKEKAKVIYKEEAHADATPVHVGLGVAKTFDLRVTFPNKTPKIVELKAVEAKGHWKVTPDGKIEALK